MRYQMNFHDTTYGPWDYDKTFNETPALPQPRMYVVDEKLRHRLVTKVWIQYPDVPTALGQTTKITVALGDSV